MSGLKPNLEGLGGINFGRPVDFEDSEYDAKKGTSDNPRYGGDYFSADEVPSESLNPEEALLAKEEKERHGDEDED